MERSRLAGLLARERATFAGRHPGSAGAYRRAGSLFGRVPMTWMNMAAGGFPLYLDRASGGPGHRRGRPEVLRDEVFGEMSALAQRSAAGVHGVISRHSLPWSVTQLGARAEYRFTAPAPAPRTGTEAAAASDPELDDYLHTYLANRGILLTPFHNMALMCPATSLDDVDRHTEIFGAAVAGLLGA